MKSKVTIALNIVGMIATAAALALSLLAILWCACAAGIQM